MLVSPEHHLLMLPRIWRFSFTGFVFLVVPISLAFSANQEDNQKFHSLVVTQVIDGDTLTLDGGTRVRLIGVDTPELHHPSKPVMFFAEEAYRFTKNLIEGKPVRLEYDQQRVDKYKRTLAYLFLEDGTFINAEIIKRGYGFAYTKFPFRYMEEFRQYEREAREQERGLWGPLVGDPETSHIVYLYESLTEEGKHLAGQALEELSAKYRKEEAP